MQALDNSIQKLQRNSGQKLKKITMAASLSVTSSLSSSEPKPSSRKMLSRHSRNSLLGWTMKKEGEIFRRVWPSTMRTWNYYLYPSRSTCLQSQGCRTRWMRVWAEPPTTPTTLTKVASRTAAYFQPVPVVFSQTSLQSEKAVAH